MDRTAHGASSAPARRLLAAVLVTLLAVTMIPAAGIQPAFADEPNTVTTDAASEGLLYKVADGKATLVGFEEGAAFEGDLVVPESVDGATIVAVEIAEGQVAEGITFLTLPQTVESVRTEGLASAFPSLASIEVDGTEGVYSTSGGMLFLQGRDAASSDGSTTLAKNRELVWAPPALVVARLPIECKAIASGAFVDAVSVETVMCPGVMESIAVAEKDGEGNVTKPGAFTGGQIASLSIVVPGTNIASPSGDRVSASVALSEDEGMEAKREAWWKHGFDSDKIVMGTSFGEVEGVVLVSDDGTVEEPSIDVLKPYEKKQLAEAAEAGDESAAARLAAPEGSGLSFSYNADMNLSVSWAGDKTATPAAIEIPAYVTIDGVKYAVTEIAPEGFKGAVFLTSVTIPEGVRIIGESAFEGCANLQAVSLPSTLRTIDYAAFRGCSALESVDVPDSVTWIGGEAFDGSDIAYLLGDFDSAESSEADTQISTYAQSTTSGSLPSNASIDDLMVEYDKIFGKTQKASYGDWTFKNATSSPVYVYQKYFASIGDDYANMGSFFAEKGPNDNIEFGSMVLSGQTFKRSNGASWRVSGNSLATIYNNKICFVSWNGSTYYKFWTELYTSETKTQPVNITNVAIAEGVSIPTFPNYLVLSTDVNKALEMGLDASMVTVGFNPGVSPQPAGFKTSVQCEAGADITGINESASSDGFDFAGWGLVNADGTKTYIDQRNEDGRLIAPAEGATYFAMWSYNIHYYSQDGSTKLSEETYLLGDPSTSLAADNGIEVHPAYSELGWATTINSEVSVGMGLGDTLGASFDPRNFSMEKADKSTYKLYAARTPGDFDLTLVGGGSASWDGSGGGSKIVGYATGDTVNLPKDVKLPGFWLAGWVWANNGTGFNGVTEPTFTINTSSSTYGNATLKAVWVPQTYRANYNVEQAGKKGSTGDAWAATPDSTTLVSSDATTAVDTLADGGEALYAWDTAYADQRAKRDNVAGAAWIDTKGITSDDAHALDLAGKPGADGKSSLDLDGFAFKGWTADSTMNAFNPVTVPTDTTYALDGDKMQRAFASVWNKTYTADEADKNQVTFYAIWQNRTIDSTGVTLNLNEPTNVNNEGTSIATLDKRGITDQAGRPSTDEGYVAPTQKIYYWQGRGLLSTAEREAIGTNSPTRKAANTIDPGMGLVAPARYGFEFLGWGKLDAADAKNEHPETATLYISYNEADNTFALTKEGAALMTGEANDTALGTDPHGDRAVIADSDWKAVWKIRDIEVSLRIPTHAVKDVDVTGASTGADRNTAGDEGKPVAGATKVDYSKDSAPYAWREVESTDPGNGATAGWYIAKRTWKYYDLLEYPAFAQQQDRYTYDAWYDTMKPSITDSTDKALQDNPAVRRIVGFNALRPTSQTHVTGAWDGTADLGLDIDDAFFLTGKTGSMNGTRGITITTDADTGKARLAKEIWLWTSPIRINVAAPMGIYLCTTNSYGQPVEPYVVGNDRRTQLEAQAEFTVSTSSHDLQLVDVTAEDVTYVERDENGNVVNEDKIESLAGLSDSGICNQILTPKFPGVGDVKDTSKPVTYTDETSRMFWVSPVPTATADQTGVIYESDTVRAKDAAAQVVDDPATSDVNEGEAKMTSEEALLHPDVDSRRYFGFGHNNDNTITDTLDAAASDKKYKLGDFVLRKSYADAGAADADRKTDGLARTQVVKNDDGAVVSTSYRFYYGLDMRRAEFNLTGLQKLIDNSAGALGYNSAFDQPLLRVKFTFAAARNPGISYYAARLDSGVAYDAAAAAADDKIDAATEITATAPAVLQ